jgi:hypothetical protein
MSERRSFFSASNFFQFLEAEVGYYILIRCASYRNSGALLRRRENEWESVASCSFNTSYASQLRCPLGVIFELN